MTTSRQFDRVERYEAGTIVTHTDIRSNKNRPYLIISNNLAAIEGDSDYIVLPFTSTTIKKGERKGKQKKKKWFHIRIDFKKCGLTEDCFIRGNKPDVITRDGIEKVVGRVDDKVLVMARKILNDVIKDASLSKYKESFLHWIDAYNVAHDTDFTLETATEQMRDEYHISFGRHIEKNKQRIRVVLKPEFAYITANLGKE